MRTQPCRGCRAPIAWVVSEKTGKPMPIDPAPAENGNLKIETGPGGLRARYVSPGSEPGLYLSHFTTCPEAPSFRRK